MSHQYESTRGTAKEPTIEYSDSTLTSAAGTEAYGDPKVYGSNPNPHDNTSDFGRDTHVNQDSLVKDRADGKDRLGNDPNTHSNVTGSSAGGDLSGTTVSVNQGSGHTLPSGQGHSGQHAQSGTGHLSGGGLLGGLGAAGAAGLASSNATAARQTPIVPDGHKAHGHPDHKHDDSTCETRPHGHPSHVHDDQSCETRPHGHPQHKHDNTCVDETDRHDKKHNTTVADPNATGLAVGHGGSAAAAGTGKVPGAGTFDTEKKTGKEVFDGPEGHHATHGHVPASGATDSFRPSTTSSGAYGSGDVGGSGMGTGIKSDYDALGNRVGPGHREGHTFVEENHGEKVGIVDKIKGKLGMNTGDERHGDFTKDGAHLDQHGSTHAGGQGGAGRI